MEDAVAAHGADCQGLGIAFEGIWRRFGTVVFYGHNARICGRFGIVAFELGENEFDVRAAGLDGFRFDEALDAQVALVGFVAHADHFWDGDKVALVRRCSLEGEVADGAQDEDAGDSDSELLRRELHD